MNKILKEDIEAFTLPSELTEKLEGSTIIVTGATGLIGSNFVRYLSALNLNIRFILPVRNKEKAAAIFPSSSIISIIETNLTEFFTSSDCRADYIIHCASPTNGSYMNEHPAETFLLAIESTKATLEYARKMKIKGMVFVSSIEYYGQIYHNNPIYENQTGEVNHNSPRSSYPLGKQAAEFLTFCYAREFDIPVTSARLTQTFGAGISSDDNRVFAQFARSAIAGKDIILHTEGLSAKPYCYIADCVAALTYILLKGKPGEAYNVATPDSFVTIRNLAELFRKHINPDIQIRIETLENAGYAPDTTVNLNSDKLLSLGWTPRYPLPLMIQRLADYLRSAE